MKLNISSIFLLLYGGIFFFAANTIAQESAHFTMQGSIVDTACAIDIDSYNQSIDLGVLPISLFRNQGQGQPQHFYIRLIGCQLTSYEGEYWKTFEISFDGPTNDDFFVLSGSAKGIALSLFDMNGNVIFPGKNLKKQKIQVGNNTLNYQLRLVADNTPLRVGNYQTAIRFKLNYY